jgi:ATP-dependent DNA helicase DinG
VSDSGEVDELLARVVSTLGGAGERRESQLEMARAVARALGSERHLVVRAGTGTGKSLAYLVPALLSGERVVVATATKALQDQLAEKDLPVVVAQLGRVARFAVLKGRANYLCLQRLREAEQRGEQGALDEDVRSGASLAAEARAVSEWAASTVFGDRAELEIDPDPRVWASFSVSADECPGAYRCPSGADCFAELARARAAEADVVVVNSHLLGAHLASGSSVLPEFGPIVIDEAHELEEVMTSSLGVSISPGRLRALAGLVRNIALAEEPGERAGAAQALLQIAEQLESALAPHRGKGLAEGHPDEIAAVLESCGARIARLERALGTVAAHAEGDEATRALRAQLVAGRLRVDLDRAGAGGDNDVVWVSDGPRPRLEVSPIDVAPLLATQLFAEHTVVMTSATIPPGIVRRLGAPVDSTDHLDVGSPFAFEEQALLYCAAHLPDRRAPDAADALHDELERLMTAAGGRTLALFTSWAAMQQAVAALRPRLPFTLLAQGEGGKGALIERFRAEPESCLFATMGFWQGVDVPGATCSLVTIDRIPFSRPDDPLLVARRARAGEQAFREIDLPRAAMLLAQGAGRLVRSAGDRGVVAVLDRRLATASYRWELVRALPPMRRTKDPEAAIEFLRALRDSERLR